MSSKFECYVTINKKKWTIVINKKINCVNFGDVYRQICKTCDPKLNISHETHVFEMFDGDHFKPLTSFGAPIKCLARIRVNLPPDVDKDKDQSTERIDNIDNNSRAKRHKSDDNRDKSGQQFVSSFKPSNDATTSGSSVQTTHHSNNEYKKSKHSSSYKKESDRESRRKESHNAFKNEGIVVKEEKTCCELCGKTFTTMTDAVKHIQSFEHMKNKREDSFDEIDKQFLAEIRDKKDIRCLLSRKQELSKFGEKEKRIFIKHGIRLKDGIGSQSYVCIRCDQSFHDSLQMVQHFNHYINQKPMPTNESINECPTSDKRTAKNVTNSDDISDTKIVDFKVPEDVADKVKQLERQGFQVIPKSKHKFVMKCRFCDFYTKSISKSFKHIESEEHIKWKTEMPFKGIDRLIVTESSNSSEIDCLLARIEAIREIPYTVKEEFLSHGMKVKDGLGANAYVCTKCNVLFERLSDCKNHLKDFKKIKNSLLNKNSDSIADELDIEKSADFELFIKQLESNCESIDSILRNEVKRRHYIT
ncbi:uncharacterized protein LOC128960975 isoform X2 [Oppia nitens]|uniref:uncharacterized protein LOC128960975 isoform X2 n=1 Tax=Oppia nitens TaxID=1686743 RepID=UPI0023DC7824|nr:uncharacterized protein LOC128960975 isoform X2 [Oppia nitens]